jgi:hypothetical protein
MLKGLVNKSLKLWDDAPVAGLDIKSFKYDSVDENKCIGHLQTGGKRGFSKLRRRSPTCVFQIINEAETGFNQLIISR